jgi:hypothetical protein
VTLENWSDLSGLLGSLALVVTAWRNDGLYGFIDKLRKAVNEAKTRAPAVAMPPTESPAPATNPDPLAGPVLTALECELTKWSGVDRWSLRVGAALLVVSYLLRLVFQHRHG